MFLGGPCTVSFFDDFSGTPVWSGTLGLSQASPSTLGANGMMHVEVDASGVVTLYSDDGATPSSTCQINVAPQYDVDALQTQAVSMSAPDGECDHGGISNDGQPLSGANHIDLTALTATSSTPGAATFAAMSGAVMAFCGRAS